MESKTGRREDGKTGRWEDGKIGRQEDGRIGGKMGAWEDEGDKQWDYVRESCRLSLRDSFGGKILNFGTAGPKLWDRPFTQFNGILTLLC